MRVYFSGIGGVGIGPLAEIAHGAGYDVCGSDLQESPITRQLTERGIEVFVGQDGSQIAAAHERAAIDWFVYTSALPDDHAELIYAQGHDIRSSKRDAFLATLLREKGLELVAVAGTHGKTTTTGLFCYAMQRLNIPISYSIGTTVSWGPSGLFDPASKHFIYECDEYDHNFLQFEPSLSVITALDYDHVDTYPTIEHYRNAFKSFLQQSSYSILWEKDLQQLGQEVGADLEAYDEHMDLSHITLPGDHVRHNAYLVERALLRLFPDIAREQIVAAVNAFPGTSRRFEKLGDNLYSDYGHHPAEIAATLQLAREISDHVVLVYQPHQNVRQHEIRDEYVNCMQAADEIYWLPTYLSREDPSLEVLTPRQLYETLVNRDAARSASMDDELWSTIEAARSAGKLVLCMGAGSIDSWVRSKIAR